MWNSFQHRPVISELAGISLLLLFPLLKGFSSIRKTYLKWCEVLKNNHMNEFVFPEGVEKLEAPAEMNIHSIDHLFFFSC